uniref:Uncharacterized protein n=1 Tax=Rhizobium rhizogenes TaxID=359 RepID=A0A7S4ZTY9_RHIRH|nr:hypothetical protein pC6.5b_383 [Rhizobium rhizogenes]
MDVSPPSGFSVDLREDADLACSRIAAINHSFTSPIDS